MAEGGALAALSQGASRKRRAASDRFFARSLWRMLLTCVSTVRGEIVSVSAIWRSVRPSASRRRTSASRALRRARSGSSPADRPPRGRLDEAPHEAGGHPPIHGQLAAQDAPHGPQERLGGQVLGQVAARPGADRLDQVAVGGGDGQHHDPRLGQSRGELADEADPVHARQVDVDEEDVRADLRRDPQGVLRRWPPRPPSPRRAR